MGLTRQGRSGHDKGALKYCIKKLPYLRRHARLYILSCVLLCKHIAHGLVPAASIAPKAAVPRTPPPRSPAPSPERPRSALAAAILSSSLTGQTWVLPPARPRSFSESDQSECLLSERNIYTRDRWSEGFLARPPLSSPDHSEEELQHQAGEEEEEEEVEDGGGGVEEEEYVSRTLDSRKKSSDMEAAVCALPLKHSPKAQSKPSRQSKVLTEDGEAVKALTEKNALLEEKLRHLEQEVSRRRAQPIRTSPIGMRAELHDARQQAQELVDENDALKRSVHRLSVELSAYQTKYRPLNKQESSSLSSLPKTGSPPPWLVDMKYLSPLMLAYEDMLNEKDALLRTAEEEVKKLRVHVEEVVKENEKFHHEMAKKTRGLRQEECHQVQQQAMLVLQENQLLIEQLEALNAKTEAEHSKHLSEVSRVSKQLMLLEADNQRLQEEVDESRREARQSEREFHFLVLIILFRQLEQEQSKNRSEVDEAQVLRHQNQSLRADNAKLMAAVERAQEELENSRQANRRTKRHLNALKQQKDECVLKEGKTRTYLEAVVSVADRISLERDQLVHMASILQQEKQGFIGSILSGTVRFGKLQERVKVSCSIADGLHTELLEAAADKAASHRWEMLHLQRLLGERQQAEERLLQSKRDVEEELEVVWQAATRENQQIKESLWHSGPTGDILRRAFADPVSPERPLSFLKEQDCDDKTRQGLDFYS
uniref:Centrosomal protein 89 n=1 Tax=Hippocampus comes TaxID=109280 RepID=A0A3Q2Z212_HIPCM